MSFSHDSLLCHARVHVHLTITCSPSIHVTHVRQSQGTTTVLIAGELLDRRVGIIDIVEFDNPCAAGTSVGLVLNLCLVDFPDRLEQLDQVVIAGGPRKLYGSLVSNSKISRRERLTLRTKIVSLGSPPGPAPSVKGLGAAEAASAPPWW